MKLLILTSYYPPEVNAASVRISQIVKRFLEKNEENENINIRIAIFNPLYNEVHEAIDECAGIEVHRYRRNVLPPSIFLPQSINPITLISWTRITAKEIKNYGPDLVLASSPPFAAATSLYIMNKIFKNNTPYIVDYRDDLTSVIYSIAESKMFFVRWVLKAANRFMSFLLFHSLKNAVAISTVNDVLKKNLLEINERVILVPNGFDVQELKDAMQNFNREEVLKKNGIYDLNSRIIIYLGDLDMPYYKPEVILESLKKLNEMDHHLIYAIIGDGTRKKFIKKMAEDMDLQDSVYLLGRKKHQDVLELLLASDVAFYSLQKGDPQSEHAIGTKVYEYVGCNLPLLAIADDGSAISDFIEGHGIGSFVSWNSLERLDSALKELLESQKYKDNLQECHEEFIDKFDRNRGIDRLYEEIMGLYES